MMNHNDGSTFALVDAPSILEQLFSGWGIALAQHPFPLGAIICALSYIWFRRVIDLPASRAVMLGRLGIYGPVLILGTAAMTSTLTGLAPAATMMGGNGAWFRIAALAATTLVLAVTALALAREALPPAGERALIPHRSWREFAPMAGLTALALVTLFFLATEIWQATSEPEPHPLTDVMDPSRVVRDTGGVPPTALGWANHGPSLIAIAALVALLVWVLAIDARRPVASLRPSSEVRAERSTTAKLLCGIALGGALLGLGAVWLHSWAPSSGVVAVHDPELGAGNLIISETRGFVCLLGQLGILVQASGAALLLRIAVDTFRARRAIGTTVQTSAVSQQVSEQAK